MMRNDNVFMILKGTHYKYIIEGQFNTSLVFN